MTLRREAAGLPTPAQRPCAAEPGTRRMAHGLPRLLAAAALALLTACGGGTSQVEVFEPLRYFALGDEDSTLEAGGRKWGVNGLNEDGSLACADQQNWTQQVASAYGFFFAQCNPTNALETNARMLARAGARAQDLNAQIDAQVAAGGFRDGDLATVMAGSNDILELYNQYPTRTRAALVAEARERGRVLARVVNRLVDLRVKVVVSTMPDLGLSPFARAQQLALQDFDRAAFLSELSTAFNEQLGVNVLLDGRFVGLVQADLQFQAINRFPAGFGFVNVSEPVCTVALPQCTTATLVEGAQPSAWLWADGTRLAPGAHQQLASLAIARAQRNPF